MQNSFKSWHATQVAQLTRNEPFWSHRPVQRLNVKRKKYLSPVFTCEQGLIFIPNGGGSLGQHRVNIVDCTDLENGALAKKYHPQS